jgi:hypothetical protein
MSHIEVLAGDLPKGKHLYFMGAIGSIAHEMNVIEIQVATEQTIRKISAKLGWGLVGGLALGPIGAVAGLIFGGNKKEVTFIARLKNGKSFLGKTDPKSFEKLQSVAFDNAQEEQRNAEFEASLNEIDDIEDDDESLDTDVDQNQHPGMWVRKYYS